MNINFECRNCRRIFDSDVGEVTVPEDAMRPHFERAIVCPSCGARTMDEVLLTELGQSQLTEATFGDDLADLEHLGECQGCDDYLPLDDMGLCSRCGQKLDRDLIRQRDWDYAASAFALREDQYEQLRRDVIARYGVELELIAPRKENSRNQRKAQRIKRQRKNR